MKKQIFLAICVLVLTASIASAQTYVFKTADDAITIDGNLSDWVDATVLSWRSPSSNVEYNFLYILHSDSYYFIGARIYDNDTVDDDSLKIYLNDTSTIYRFDLEEGSNIFSAYKYVNGTWVLTTVNATLVYTSSIQQPYTYVELRIPKSALNNSSTLLLYVEYVSTIVRAIYSWYPPNSNFNDYSTWEVLKFIEIANRTLNLSISDRDGVPIYYANGDVLVEVRYTLNNTHIVSLAGHPNMSILLPPANVTVLIKYLDIPIFEKSYNLSLTNISDSISINNLLKVDTPFGYLIISVERNGTLKSVDFDYAKGRAIVVTQSKEIFFDSETPWLFLGVLYADSYEYNPLTGHLLVKLSNTKDAGLVLVIGDGEHPVLTYASNTVKFISFDYDKKAYSFYVSSGTYKFSSQKKPFAIAFNDSALRIGVNYFTDVFNVTTVNVASEGLLDVYYTNPTSISVEQTVDSFKVYIATPYSFNGKIHYVVKRNNQSIEDNVIFFRATAPLTSVVIKPATSGDLELTVYDLDSNKILYSTSVQQQPYDYTPIILSALLVAAIIITIVLALRRGKEKARAKVEESWRFFKRL